MEQEEIQLPHKIELDSEEIPILLVRQHWYVFRNPIMVIFIVPFFLLAGIFLLELADVSVRFAQITGEVLLYGAGISFITGFLWLVWKLYLWRKTFYLVTDKRLIIVTQRGLFHHEDRESSLSMLQWADVKAEIKGLEANVYGFGDVIIQSSTTDEGSSLVLSMVGNPRHVQRIIMRVSSTANQ